MWIGSHIPDEYVDNIETWAEKNPDYQVLIVRKSSLSCKLMYFQIYLWADNFTSGLQNKLTVRDVFK
jgi:hypothetical protein